MEKDKKMKLSPTLLKFIMLGLLLTPLLLFSADQPEPLVRFGMATDVHYAIYKSPKKRPECRASLEKFRDFVQDMNREKVDFIIELGDFIGRGHPLPEEFLSWLKAVEDEFVQFSGPRYHVIGNHDTVPLDKPSFLQKVENTGIPRDRNYYSFTVNGIQFIVLDSNYRVDGSSYGDGGDWSSVAIPAPELEWLKQTLASHSGKTIVFVHHPLHVENKKETTANGPEVRKVLEDSGKVLAVFCGHRHDGGEVLTNGIHYYILKSLCEVPGVTSYAVVEVFPDHTVKLKGFGRTADETLEYKPAAAAETALPRN